MSDGLSRRDALRVLGAAGAAALAPGTAMRGETMSASDDDEIIPLVSTSEVFIPPRARAYDKFSFDFPEPSVEIDGLRFGAMLFTRENAYGLDRGRMRVERRADGVRVRASGLVWAGGQERASGQVVLDVRRVDGALEWTVSAECAHPIKSVATVLRGVPRGSISAGGGDFFDPHDDEVLLGYPFSGGDLFGPGAALGLTTPLVIIKQDESHLFALSSLDDRVRAKRIFLQPGESGYRAEAIWEVEGWRDARRVEVPAWRASRVTSLDGALAPHYAHVARAHRIPTWDARPDVPGWLRRIALVTTMHGQHYTGYIFNDYARQLEILRWMAGEIPAERVLVFLAAWDGRYYWDYPDYRASERMGGEAGLSRLIDQGHRLGFRFMPMFGANAANRRRPSYAALADAATSKIDGDRMDLNWVDWDNDRHQDGWLAYMNLGVASWRRHLTSRIADVVDRYGVDAYFLDIAGGWTNNPTADMHEGMRRLVGELRSRYPRLLACGEMHYDALLESIPLYHAGGGGIAREHVQRHARFFQHLSHPAPGRGSSGVHESGFGELDPETLSLSEHAIPTLNIVDDTFARHRETMHEIIRRAKLRARIA